jgi:glutamate 5-kinase
MSDRAETAAARLWRDRTQLREQERNEAQARARTAEERLAALIGENERLATENARLSGQNDRLAAEVARLSDQNDRLATEVARLRTPLTPDPACAPAEAEREVEALRDALLSMLAEPSGGALAGASKRETGS